MNLIMKAQLGQLILGDRMKRSIQGTAALLALCVAVPASAADYSDLRPAYPDSWETSEENPLRIEMGVRYWYSVGQQNHQIGASSETMNTRTSSGEVFARVDDYSTRSYVDVTGGYAIGSSGDYSTNGGPSLELPAARLGYVGGDFGWMPFGTETASVGFLAGYQYLNDSPDTGRANFTTAESAADISWTPASNAFSVPGDSEINDFNINLLKLGFAGRFDAGPVDITAEAAAIPYSWIGGTYGSYSLAGQTATVRQASAVTINGFGYGAFGKLMVGVKPTKNLAIRVGGRATYIEGQYDATYDRAVITPPQGAGAPYTAPSLSRQTFIIDNNPFSMFRYGALLEVAGSF